MWRIKRMVPAGAKLAVLLFVCVIAGVGCGGPAAHAPQTGADPAEQPAGGPVAEPSEDAEPAPEGFAWFRSVLGFQVAVPVGWRVLDTVPERLVATEVEGVEAYRQVLRGEARARFLSLSHGDDEPTFLAITVRSGSSEVEMDRAFIYELGNQQMAPNNVQPLEMPVAGAETLAAVGPTAASAQIKHVWLIRFDAGSVVVSCSGPREGDNRCEQVWGVVQQTFRLMQEQERNRLEQRVSQVPPRSLGGAVWSGRAPLDYDPGQTEAVVLARANREQMHLYVGAGTTPDCVLTIREPSGAGTCDNRDDQQWVLRRDGNTVWVTQSGQGWIQAGQRVVQLAPASPMAVAIAIVAGDRGNTSSESDRLGAIVQTAEAAAARRPAAVMDADATEVAIVDVGVQPQTVWLDAALRIARRLKENRLLPLRYDAELVERWRREVVSEALNRLPPSTGD